MLCFGQLAPLQLHLTPTRATPTNPSHSHTPQCPRIVSLLAESFNPHVRYGAAMAVGIACAGSGGREAVALLESMIADSVDFVRQGVYIALSLVQLQQPEARVEGLRKRLAKAVADKHEETMARMGAAIATGARRRGGGVRGGGLPGARFGLSLGVALSCC